MESGNLTHYPRDLEILLKLKVSQIVMVQCYGSKGRNPEPLEMEELLFQWIMSMRRGGRRVTQTMIKKRAKEIYSEIHEDELISNKGRLDDAEVKI